MTIIQLFILWFFIGPIITSGMYWDFHPAITKTFNLVDELIILLLLLRIAVEKIKSLRLIKLNLSAYLYFLLITVFLSSLLNFTSPFIIVEFIIRYVKIFIIMYYCYQFYNKSHYSNIFNILIVIFKIQFIVNLLWALDFRLLPNAVVSDTYDWAIGTAGDSFYVCALSFLALSYYLIKYIQNFKISTIRYNEITAIVISIIQIYWTHSKVMLVLCPFIIIISLITLLDYHRKYKIIFIILFGSIIFSPLILNVSTQAVELYERAQGFYKMSPKVSSYNAVFGTIDSDPLVSLFGLGLGQGASFIARENGSKFHKSYIKYDNIEGSILTNPYSGIISIKSELGYLGVTIFVLFFIIIIKNLYKKIKNTNPYSEEYYFLFASFSWMIFYSSINIITDNLQHTFLPIMTGIIAGFSLSIKNEINRKLMSKAQLENINY